jgi:ribosome-associated protein
MDLKIKDKIVIKESELKFEFIRASGPGGQNVNKVSTAAQLRFNLKSSSAFSNEIKEKLLLKLSGKLSKEGEIIITAKRYRYQERNRSDALDRLRGMILKALETKRKRKATKPTKSSKEERLKLKKIRSEVKKKRSGKIDFE